MAEGLTDSLFEIFEMTIATVLFLSILSAILFISNPNHLQAQATAKEMSYVASLVTNHNVKVYTKIKDTKIAATTNGISVTYKDVQPIEETYIGNKVSVSENSGNSYLITSK